MVQWSTRYRRLREHQADDRLTRAGENYLPVREGMSGLFLRFGLLGGAQLAGSALSFLTAVIITRIGGAVVFGQISVGLSVLAYALIATNFGTDVSGVRMAAANPERIGAMLPGIMAIRLFFGVLTFAVILLLAPILAPDPQGRVIMLIICFGLFAGAILPAWLPQGIENAKVTALCVFGPFALTFAFTALSALVAPSGRAFAVSRLSADAVVAASLFAWAWRFHDGSRWKEIRAAIRDLLGQSSAIAGTQLVRGLAFLSDILIVSFFYHDATVGHFSAAYRIYLLLIAVSAMYFIVLFPKLARAAERGPEALKTELRATLRWTIPSTSLMALAFTAVVPWLLPLAFGADFSAAVPALQVLGIAAALNFIQRNYSRALVAMGFPGVEFRVTAVATVVGIALKVVGTWQWGITGTAAALLLGEGIMLILLQRSALHKLRRLAVR